MRSEIKNKFLAGLWSWFSVSCIHCARVAWYLGVLLFVVAVVAITVFRFWLPALVDRKAEVETYLSKQIGQSVAIGEMAADWQGLYPSLHARKLSLIDDSGSQDFRLSLDELSLDLDILPLLKGKLVFRQVTLVKPVVHVSRSPEGEFFIGSFKAPPPKKGRLEMFFQQYKISISDGRFIWHDHFLKEKEFTISGINFSMTNKGKAHILEGSVEQIGAVTKEVSVKLDVRGDIMDMRSWNGKLLFKTNDLEFSGLPGIVKENIRLPVVAGTVTLNLSADWADGRLATSSGHVYGKDLLIPLGEFGSPFSVNSVEADINFKRTDESWVASLDNTQIAIAGSPWSAGQIQVFSKESESSLHIDNLKMADFRPVLDALTSKNKIVQLVRSLYPSGNASNTSLTLYGSYKKPDDILYKMSISDATVHSYKIYPAMTGLQANIRVSKNDGSVEAVGKKSRIVLDRVYEYPLGMDDLQANVVWKKEEDSWKVEGKRLWLKNADAELLSNFVATIPFDHGLPPLLMLSVDLTNGNLSQAGDYFPVLLMKPGIRKWFEQTRFRGRLKTAKLRYDGTVKGFPVAGAESFNVVANIEDGSMNFSPGWPRLIGINADLEIGKNDLWVKGFARELSGQKVENSTVHLANLAETGKQVVNVNAELHGDLAKVMGFLQTGPLFRGSAFQETKLAAEGHGKMKLDISIPLASTTETRVIGEYITTNASLKLPDDSWVTGLKGKLDFTERSISSSGMKGVKLGGPVVFDVKTVKVGQPPVVEIDARGKAYANEMEALLGEWISKELKGSISWQGRMRFDENKITLNINSDLVGLSSVFPYPLEKDSEKKLPLQVDVIFKPENKTELKFFMPSFVNGKLFFSTEKQDAGLTGGCLLVGKDTADCTDKKGLTVSVVQDELDLDPWDSYIKRQDGNEGVPDVLSRMTATVDKVYYAKVDMADVELKVDRQKDASWRGKVIGDRVKGDVEFNLDRPSRWVKLRLEKLIWNKADGEPAPTEKPLSPLEFPRLDVVINDLVFHKMKLGKLSLLGEATASEWELQFLKLDRPEMKVSANGRWIGVGEMQRSSFGVDFTSTDMRSTILALDYNIDLESKEFRTTGDISWNGAPYDYNLNILDGTLEVHSESGRLSGVEVGAGRLLGVFNIDSLRRRLLLDFSDLSKEGFAFDTIDANASVKLGVAEISKLIMYGPSATIKLEGQLGLVNESVDMKMSVLPAFGGNLAIAGYVLGGPAGGVVTYIASKAIKTQIEKSDNYQYTITGLWDNPVVEKIQTSDSNREAENLDDDTIPGG